MGTTSTKYAEQPLGIFISYTRDDIAYAKKLQEHLHFHRDEHEGPVFFDENRIEAGDQWDLKIHDAIQTYSLFVVLISASYFNSSYAYPKEFKAIGKRYGIDGVRILPIQLSSFNWADYRINDTPGTPKLGQLDALGPCTKDGGKLLAFDQLSPAEQAEQWKNIANKLCELAGCIREPEAQAVLTRQAPRIDEQHVRLVPDTCLAFVDRVAEVKRCGEELTLSSRSVLPVIVAGSDRDWPQALALRLQAETPGNLLQSREHMAIEWPSKDIKTRDERVRLLSDKIREESATAKSPDGLAVPGADQVALTTSNEVGPELNSMIQRGGRRFVVSYLIPASDWLTLDKEVMRDHIAWWDSIITGQHRAQVILLLAIIHPSAVAKASWWSFGRKQQELSAAQLAAMIPGAISLMADRDRLQPIVKVHLALWIDKVGKLFHLPHEARKTLYGVGDLVMRGEKANGLPHYDFRNEILYHPHCAGLFENAS